jgi:fucose 4-O-acetylase-like acetyltransferase
MRLMMNTQIQREKWSDIARGIGILLVILGHIPSMYPHIIREVIYSFHMPLFFILSGYWFSDKRKKTSEFIIYKFKKILVPYFLFNFLFLISGFILNDFNTNIIIEMLKNIFYTGNGISITWFFVCLYNVEVIFYLLHKITTPGIFYICTSTLCISGFILAHFDIFLPFKAVTALCMLLYYWFGYFLRHQSIKSVPIANNTTMTLVVLAAGYLGSFLFGYVRNQYIQEVSTDWYPIIVVSVITSLTGSLITISIARSIESLTIRYCPDNLVYKTLSVIGQESLIIFPLSKWIPDTLFLVISKFNLLQQSSSNVQKIICYFISLILIILILTITKKIRSKQQVTFHR